MKKNKREAEILGKFFTITGNTAKVRLEFDTFSEFIDPNIGDNKVEYLNSNLTDKLSVIFAQIPQKYKIEVDVCIKDFGDYTQEEAENIVRDNVQLMIHGFLLEQNRKRKISLTLLGCGIVMLLVSYSLSRISLPTIFFDIMNISGTLFVWEAASIGLIEKKEDIKRAWQYVKQLKSIRILQA